MDLAIYFYWYYELLYDIYHNSYKYIHIRIYYYLKIPTSYLFIFFQCQYYLNRYLFITYLLK